MALKQWLIKKELAKSIAKSIAESDLLCNTPPRALSKFKEQVWSTLESQLKDSLERGYPHFEISFSSEEVSGEVVQILVLEILDSALTSEGIGYSVSSHQVRYHRGERHDPAHKRLGRNPSHSIVVRGTVTKEK